MTMTTNGLRPTEEQHAAVDAFATGNDMKIEAGAGTGKTSTLKLLAGTAPSARGVYLAFGKAIATEAKRTFPSNVSCATAHSFAYRAVGHAFARRLNGPRVTGQETAKILGITKPYEVTKDLVLAPKQIARLAMDTVTRFCYSEHGDVQPWHVPPILGVDDSARDGLAQLVMPLARKAWRDLTSVDGRLKFGHDHYLKLWQLSGPKLPADFVLLDEAQDANPVIAAVFNAQTNAQRILVGDSNQAIYGWRGAIDAMAGFRADHHLYLSQSFRFGPAIADEANKWLRLLGAQPRLSGTPSITSRVETLAVPDAVLCRTNAHAVATLLRFHRENVPAAIVGGGRDILALAQAAITLKAGAGCDHPELYVFQTWAQVQDYVENDHGGSDLEAFVKLIDSYGPEAVIRAVDQAVDERRARVIVSTAHKAKGREWSTVRVADDFAPQAKADSTESAAEVDALASLRPPARADQMLAYVAVTRARHALDRGGLAWIDDLVGTVGARARLTGVLA
jgi:hypothetical protein